MLAFDEYATKYQTVRMRREGGILELRLHADGKPFRWGRAAAGELEKAFLDVGRDRENHVIILTGTGKEFSGPPVRPVEQEGQPGTVGHGGPQYATPAWWDGVYWEGKHLLTNLLNIEVPMISAINGPALRHAEIPLLCDVVLASEAATFQDSAHFSAGSVPGDGMHVVFPLLMGLNRGRYFLLTGQTLSAAQALNYGLVNEVLPEPQLLSRAWDLARQFMLRPPLVRRYARVLLTEDLKRRMQNLLGYGLALEGLADPRIGRGSARNALDSNS